MKDKIVIKGARTNNLKNINLTIPKKQLVVFTGVSGSGKSSLVFDTIFTEAQRQLIETFSSFARRRLPKLSRPSVDEIKNISTAIVIDQKRLGRNLRSTVGTATEISTYLRMLYSRFGQPFIGPSFYFSFNHPEGMCPACKGLGKRITVDIHLLLDKSKSIREGAITHPDYKTEGWNWREIVACKLFDADKPLNQYSPEELDKLLFTENIPITREHGAGIYRKAFEGIVRKLERQYIDKSEDELPEARKDAYQRYFLYLDCNRCNGTRLNERARSIEVNGKSIADLSEMELTDLDAFLAELHIEPALNVINKMRSILSHLIHIDVGYLSLNRAVSTLSGGESQRVKMARQLDCDLVDMMYILDEPSIGLHPKDNEQLIALLKQLRDKGNSTLVVEHDNEMMKHADWIVDVGPGSGINGGSIVYEGTYEGLVQSDSITGKYLKYPEKKAIERKHWSDSYAIKNASNHNLKNITVQIPKYVLTCITGVAGSGKSSLVHGEFLKAFPEAIVIDQTPAGKSSRSTPVSYIGAFDLIRKEIADATKSNASNFSFNSKGACEKCKGQGFVSIEMNFLDDVKMGCDECNGQRFKDEVLQIRYKNKNIFEILNLKVAEAIGFFENKEIKKRLGILFQVGLDYLDIGQPLSSLSGGEAQRIKIAAELHKKGNVYVMDEPTIGLHMADIDKLVTIIKSLTSHNNTVIIIEHNLDIIKQADWIIDMGPGGGHKGGLVIAEGTPEVVAKNKNSVTGKYLEPLIIIE
jgi:excinuclease UvrABC ATPase subunit